MVFFKLKKKILEAKLRTAIRSTAKKEKRLIVLANELKQQKVLQEKIKVAKTINLTKSQQKILNNALVKKQQSFAKRKAIIKKVASTINKRIKDSGIKFTPNALFEEKTLRKIRKVQKKRIKKRKKR